MPRRNYALEQYPYNHQIFLTLFLAEMCRSVVFATSDTVLSFSWKEWRPQNPKIFDRRQVPRGRNEPSFLTNRSKQPSIDVSTDYRTTHILGLEMFYKLPQRFIYYKNGPTWQPFSHACAVSFFFFWKTTALTLCISNWVPEAGILT